MTDTSDAIFVERLIRATPDRVFALLTKSEEWSKWQGTDAMIDATVGGIFRMEMGNGATARGQFLEIVENRRVVFTWGWVDHPGVPPGSSTVAIDLVAHDGSTLVRLQHVGLASDEIPFHVMGWDHYLPRLAVVAEGEDPGPDPGP